MRFILWVKFENKIKMTMVLLSIKYSGIQNPTYVILINIFRSKWEKQEVFAASS